jgi:RNAse (barnase) inhibitor barstar
VAAFELDAELNDDDLDFRLVMNGFITLFWRPAILSDTTRWLQEHGYEVKQFDAAEWKNEQQAYLAIGRSLDFPNFYGRNVDALDDCMGDVVAGDYGWPENATGLVLAFQHYDSFTEKYPRAAQILLDIFADQGRSAALFGRRFFCLVQSDDPQIKFAPVGATSVHWNDAESLASKRRAGD